MKTWEAKDATVDQLKGKRRWGGKAQSSQAGGFVEFCDCVADILIDLLVQNLHFRHAKNDCTKLDNLTKFKHSLIRIRATKPIQ